jgi:putative ABC transport system permease protein
LREVLNAEAVSRTPRSGCPSDGGLETAEDGQSRFIRLPRFTAVLSGVCGAGDPARRGRPVGRRVALVAQRTREMGIRMALGASPSGARRLVIVQALPRALIGRAAGLVLGASRRGSCERVCVA